jgi:hypothetical protein
MGSKAKAIAIAATKKTIFNIPLLGWLLRDAVNGGPTAILWFIFNMVASWLVAIYYIGYPAIIIPALAAVPSMFVVIFLITWDKAE